MLGEMLRVGRLGIVSFPNFAWWRIRMSLLVDGRMPTTERLPYRWHDTPNIHLFTLQDFLDWIAREHVKVVRAFAFGDGLVRPLGPDDALKAEEALFFLSR
jgi:methionine biosynthesis protein MetW